MPNIFEKNAKAAKSTLSGIPLMIWKRIKTPPPKQKHLETAMKKTNMILTAI